MTLDMNPSFSSQEFRQVLGQYPTGVVVVSALVPGEAPVALTIGSFSSISLDPPLVGFYPSKDSSTWPKIAAQGRFCINVLSAEQEVLCRAFAQKGPDKFAGVPWHPAPSGSPIIDGAVAWIDCEMEDVQTLGDHFLVVGRVTALDTEARDLPLLFFRGGYGRFLPSSLAAAGSELAEYLPVVDLVRPELERVARDCDSECLLVAHAHDEFVVLAGAGVQSNARGGRPTRVGRRLPYLAPLGAPLAAWGDPSDVQRWISPDNTETPEVLAQWRDMLQLVRERGYVIGSGDMPYADLEHAIDNRRGGVWDDEVLGALAGVRQTMLNQPSLDDSREEYDVRSLSVPIFLADGRVVQMGLYGLEVNMSREQLERCIDRLISASWRCTDLLGGSLPADFPRSEPSRETVS